jgi:hypothetical protein
MTVSARTAGLLAKRGDLEEAEQILRVRADAGDLPAAIRLSKLQVGVTPDGRRRSARCGKLY